MNVSVEGHEQHERRSHTTIPQGSSVDTSVSNWDIGEFLTCVTQGIVTIIVGLAMGYWEAMHANRMRRPMSETWVPNSVIWKHSLAPVLPVGSIFDPGRWGTGTSLRCRRQQVTRRGCNRSAERVRSPLLGGCSRYTFSGVQPSSLRIICEGAARASRTEVSRGMHTLRIPRESFGGREAFIVDLKSVV